MEMIQNFKNFIKLILDKIYLPFLTRPAITKFSQARSEANSLDKVFDLANNFSFGPKIRPLYIDLKPVQQKAEILKLLDTVRNLQPQVVLEIGTASGGTLFFWTEVAKKDALIISIDLPFGKFGAGYLASKIKFLKSLALDKQRIELIRADSHLAETELKLKELLKDRLVDFMFIDADHTYEGVKKDFETYKKFVRPGGIIAFHDIIRTPDYSDIKVEELWRKIKEQYQNEEYISDPNQEWYGIGLIHV